MKYPGGWLGVLRLVVFLGMLYGAYVAGSWNGSHRHFKDGQKAGFTRGWNDGLFTGWNIFVETCRNAETFSAGDERFHCGPVKDL